MTSEVQIANIALITYLGMARINSLDQPGASAQSIKAIIDDTRRELLSEWPWSFATRRRRLAVIDDNDRQEWAYRYASPAGMIRLNWVNSPEVAKQALSDRKIQDEVREVEEGSIYCDTPEATAEFIFDQKDGSTYHPKFVQAFAALLAGKIAIPLTETSAKADYALRSYRDLLDEAKVADQQLSPPIMVATFIDWSVR